MSKEYHKVNYKQIPLFANVTDEQWNDWKWQLKNAIRDIPTLCKVTNISKEEQAYL